ncbi:hypothetical protein LTR62_000163 [Meristemomyces frigidus]|uniref:GDP/GTP exchange factor Sec2 N-terminal domain-containing protein n=1 Tax=Meristemomyces frigidus TaxID=1508187 RepID=A0AAN7TQD1_9PEZI|nr:hypothetical protein LTR62_000163 [Meristemomyces frigidus]
MAQHVPHDSALSISSGAGDAARVKELEEENKKLLERCNIATQHYADYENEIIILKAQVRQAQRRNDSLGSNHSAGDVPAPGAVEKPGISRFGSFMHSRKASPTTNGTAQASTNREEELTAEVVKEKLARIEAEKKVKEASDEIEELSATLFEQANEMVATARRENAMLVEKLQVLEEQTIQAHAEASQSDVGQGEDRKLEERLHEMETRDVERRRRLAKLEAAVERIDHVRSMLVPR